MNKKIVTTSLIIIILAIVIINYKSPTEKEEEKYCKELLKISIRSKENDAFLWKSYDSEDVKMCKKYGIKLKSPFQSFLNYEKLQENLKNLKY